MADIFVEKMVKKKRDGKDFAKIALCVLLVIWSVVMSLRSRVFLLLVVVFVLLGFLMVRICDVEYEYQYINGYFDVDKIFYKARRKNIFEANMANLVVIAPESAAALSRYSNVKVYDFTSGYGNESVYGMVFSEEGILKKVLFEPGEKMLAGIASQVPGKVVRN